MKDEIILVDTADYEIGTANKLFVHKSGLLHRAVSVFIFNNEGKILLQQRALHKYHSAGLWSNTACSHPLPGEHTKSAAERRLYEEMGINCELRYAFNFIYKAEFENGLTEHEFDHVYFGFCNDNPIINSDEVMDYKWFSVSELQFTIITFPEKFTVWFKICFEKIYGKSMSGNDYRINFNNTTIWN